MARPFVEVICPDDFLAGDLTELLAQEGFGPPAGDAPACRLYIEPDAGQMRLCAPGGEERLRLRLPFRFEAVLAALPAEPAPAEWRFDPLARLIAGPGGAQVRLTEKEAVLVSVLSGAPQGLGRSELLEAVWSYRADVHTHTLETHLHRLRRKLADAGAPAAIDSEGGSYRLSGIGAP